MMLQKLLPYTLLLLAISKVAISQTNPLKDPNICGRPTCKEGGKFLYTPGTQHNYKYTVNVSTIFVGTSKNESKLEIEAQVYLDFISQCDGILTLTNIKLSENSNTYDLENGNVQLNGDEGEESSENEWNDEDSSLHTNSKIFSEAIGEHTVRFSFQDGLISEVCPQEDESNWVLNFKKGLLSMIHNSMKRFDIDHTTIEEDIRGRCTTDYKILGTNGTSLIIEKTKDLNTCESRSKLHSMIQSTPYNFRVNYKGESMLKSRSNCKLSIDHHVYNDIVCEESHVFQPFSNQAAGATTIVQQRLILIDEIAETIEEQSPIERRSSLLYDHVPTPKPTSGELKASRDLIKKLCKLNTDDVQTEFSDLFTKFIHTLRLLSYPALETLYKHTGTLCTTGKKHVLDALPYLGSNAAIALMKDIILERTVSDVTAQEWVLAMALIPRPDHSMLESVLDLLRRKTDASTVLGVSSLTHTYCKQNADCRSQESVDGIIQLLEDRLTDAYNSHKTDRETQETIVVSLKAVSNIGVASDELKEKLVEMIEDGQLDMSIRVAAVDTHRRFPCDESRQYFEKLFRREHENAEIRIAAYLQVMRCPNYVVIRTIKHSLEYEEVNQVGSFIWSHLHNLLKSSIPSRVEIQGLLSDKDLGKKFSSDVRKFSHNYEGSVFFEEYNVGANYESNVIFSPDSYVPKTGMLNLTVDLFGESINLLEIYGRIEGIEHYLESVFGPKGQFSSRKLEKFIPKMRWPRNAFSSNNEYLKSQIDDLPNIIEDHFGSPKVALGMKLFGNELKYATFNGDEEIKKALRTLNPVDHLKHILSGKEINYNKAAMFLDTSYVVSSAAGLPVTLNAVGTTSINMKLLGSLSVNNFIQTKELDLTGILKPSVALDIIGTMSVDAYYASTAIKLKTNMYSSSAIEGHVKIRGSKLVSVKFGIPKETTEIFGAKSELIVMRGNIEEQQTGMNGARVTESLCSWPAVEKTVGLKLCADYHFTNVTKIPNATYFILAGPAGFRVSLQKSDPTAKTYLLEYKWNDYANGSYISVTFDTPGAVSRRVMGANLTIDRESQNLTLLLESTEGTVLARGKYKNTDMEKYIHLGLDINNQKNFDARLSLEKKEIRNGYVYHPELYLGINATRVAELEGTLKVISKADISQYDVDLKFQTKRLTSKLFGYISKSGASLEATLKLDYHFEKTKKQGVALEFSLRNRSRKNIFVIEGDCAVETTAYPNYNFNSTLSLQKSGGHIESKFILNASPHLRENLQDDPKMLRLQLLLSYRALNNGTKFHTIASLKRASTELDVKGQLSYDVFGYSTNAMALVRYAKGKNVVVTVSWYHPRHTFENIEGRLNITIPNFTPMILEVELKEKNPGDYNVDLKATWFSGHSIHAKGLYQDRCTDSDANHRLKLVLRSPSFNEINADCYYYQNNTEFKIDVKADQNNDDYALYVKYTRNSPYEITSLGKLKYKTKVYSISSFVSLKEKRRVELELHIDQIQDINLSIWVDNKVSYKEAGFEVKWDANRDPDQKLAVTVYYSNPKVYDHTANFHLSYPGRTIKGLFDFMLSDGHFATLSKVTWNPDDAFSMKLAADYKNDEETEVFVLSELLTPFDEWRKTSLNGGFRHSGNMYRANGSMYWQHDQHISIDLFGDYAATGPALKCEFTGSLNSTVHDIPSLSASVKHSHNSTKVDSELSIKYHPKQKIAVTSTWHIDEDDQMKNLTGTVTIFSPFKGFNKGLLVSKIYVTNTRDLGGVADLDLDHRKFHASVEGHLQKLSKSMLVFNVTTPIEKFKIIKGRFGFSEENKHLVAKVDYPSGAIGIEVRFFVQSLSNFDLKFNLATPIEFLQEILIVAKLKPENADFRVGWNSLLVGFSGVWHYANIRDFEYSYKIYTPFEDFEENGIVAKLIFKEGLDFEVSVRLAENRLGVIVMGQPKPKILKQLGIKTQIIYNTKLNSDEMIPDSDEDESDEDIELDEEEEDPFNWTGFVEFNTLVYPPMTAEVDIDQKGSVYDVMATLTLPGGKAELRDEFDFTDVFTMKNRLTLSTPYQTYKLVTSNYEFKIMMGHQYLLALDFNYQNGSQWIKTGTFAHYATKHGPEGASSYNVTLHIHTPFEIFPGLDVNGALEKEDNAYSTNFSMLTNRSDISFSGDLEMDDGLLDAVITTHAITPLFVLPRSRMDFKKDFSDIDNRIEFNYKMLENMANRFKLDTVWKYESIKNMKANVLLETPFKSMERSEAGMHVDVTENNALVRGNLVLFPIDLKANATIIDGDVGAACIIDFNGKLNVIILKGEITKAAENKREMVGHLMLNDKKHDISAVMEIENELPSNVEVQVQGHDGGLPLNLHYQMQSKPEDYTITTTLKQGQNFAKFQAHTLVRHKFDWDLRLQIETSHQIYTTFTVNAKAASTDVNKSISIEAITPFERLQNVQMGASYKVLDLEKQATAFYEMGESSGSFASTWSWLLLENMNVTLIGNHQRGNYKREATMNAFYVNPRKMFTLVKVGGGVDLNKIWVMESNLTFSRPGKNKIELEANMQLPKPNTETHTILGKFHGSTEMKDIEYAAKYRTLNSNRNYGSSGYVSYRNLTHFTGDVLVEWHAKQIRNFIQVAEKNRVNHLLYKLNTPKFREDQTLVANCTYLKWTNYHNVTGELFYPGNRSVAVAQVNFREFANMNAFLNVTTPFKGFNYTGADFHTETNAKTYNRYIQAFWPNNTAFLDAKCTTTEVAGSAVERDTRGLILMELPLTTRHFARVDYEYNKMASNSKGQAIVEYNKSKVLEGKYNCVSESRAGFDKDTIHVEVENNLVPIGADYIHGYEYGAPGDGSNTQTVDAKYIRAYNLHNKSAFDVTGDMRIHTKASGQEITLMAIHSNRTVKFITDYDILDNELKQFSRIELGPTAWFAYNIDLVNQTTDETSEAQQIQINVSYPRRNFTAQGSYNISNSSLSSEMSLVWDKEGKTVQAGLDWVRDEDKPNRQRVLLELRHPSFEKNVSFLGEYEKTETAPADVQLTVNYSADPDQLLTIRGLLEDNSNHTMLNYTYSLLGSHPATKLNLDVRGGVYYKRRWYYSAHLVDYQRTYLPRQSGIATTRLDLDHNEIEIKRDTRHELSYLWGRYAGKFPLYTANVSAIHGKDINASGEFYLNFKEKLLQLELNKTTDGSQSLHMYGYIPDARSAVFDIWRDYEEIRVSDVAYLLRLNHSRLVVSSLRWRPELKQDIKDGIRAASVGLYNDIMENTDYWRQYIRSETAAAISDIWQDAKPGVQSFLDDVRDLRVIEEDLDELRVFLNESYHANEFYIKDVVGFMVYIVDELSIRSHIESLPAIVSEIWEVMGDSGKKIQKSILWVIEKIKSYYKNAAEFINGLFQGDSVEHVSEALKQLVEKYDNFIKDMHVSFIRYMEQLWKQTYKLLLDNWHRTLAAIEPTFIEMVHYLETIVWNASKEFLDFLYIRKHELIDNPYFTKISNFTHDLDIFYKDITGNDTISAIYKYTKIGWNFVKQKYIELVPFGKELQEIINEIVNEIYELRKLPSISYLIEKFNEIEQKAKWFCDYFDIENRAHRFITLIHLKLTDMKQTALQAENRYREAKTKFIFEPADGIMHMEQKLPMSWHAFNETPKFEEIPEYKAINDIQNCFSTSKMTFSSFYHDYKPYTDPSDWLPPFKAQAMLAGPQYYITFDRKVYNFNGGCTYLLASDFIDRNFSIAVSYNENNERTHELLVLINDTVIHIDVFANTVNIANSKHNHLPYQIGDTYLYQEHDIVTLESKLGFELKCNMKFDVCMFEVSGWYFGKTAGLWGTMNNELSDDLLTSTRNIVTSNEIEQFAASWSLDEQCASAPNRAIVSLNTPEEVKNLCENFFISNVSPFFTCFPRVSSKPFYDMCVNSVSEDEACTAAVAYMKLCTYSNTPLRIPDACVKCDLVNGSTVPEGNFVSMSGDEVPQMADIVFIVEAKLCNEDVNNKKKLDEIITQLDKELHHLNVTHNRYSVVVFGGSGVFDRPRSIVINSRVFTEHQLISSYFDHIPTGDGNSDIFDAISYATKLIFRPGVSKSFILLPCTNCQESNMKLDYAILHQLLLENDIVLHILMNEEFRFKKPRMNKIFFGVDRKHAYTKKDAEVLVGDSTLRKSVLLPKNSLGYCTPLALETNGSVFSGKKLETEKPKAAKKIAAVFAKRVARSAVPNTCKTCECTAHNSGVSYMECFPCSYPTPATIDYGYNEDEMLAVMQPGEEDFFDYSD